MRHQSWPDCEALVNAAATAQVELTVAELPCDPVLKPLIAAGKTDVLGGVYALRTGAVTGYGPTARSSWTR